MQINRMSDVSKRAAAAQYDEGLRAYMLKVYNYMAMALVITGALAFGVSTQPQLMQAIYGTPMKWVVMLAPLGIVIYLSLRIHKLSFAAAQGWFWAYSAVMGVSLAYIFAVYTGESIARAFFMTASLFGFMSLYGYTTKKDLTGMGTFLMMGLFGVIIAALVNLFMKSSAMSFAIDVLVVVIFTGLTAYDTQKIKDNYYQVASNAQMAGKAAIMGALTLYLDFINLMLALLRLFGDRR